VDELEPPFVCLPDRNFRLHLEKDFQLGRAGVALDCVFDEEI
jgi:hypothetical protein